jgi:hypothetical protein
MPARLKTASRLLRAVLRLAEASGATAGKRFAPPTGRSERALAAVAHRGFQISLLISAAFVFGLLALDTHAVWLGSVKLALGATITGEGILLATDWRGARRFTLWRLRRQRGHSDHSRSSIPARLAWKLASPALQLLGVIWLAVGLVTAASAAGGLV